VTSDPGIYSSVVPQAQVAGLPVLVIGTKLGREVVEEGVTGFMPKTSSDVEDNLQSIERSLVSNKLRRHVHEGAKQRFSAQSATEDVILGLFPEIMAAAQKSRFLNVAIT